MGHDARASSLASRLARLGFTEPARAERLLATGPLADQAGEAWLLDALGAVADPDLALTGLIRLLEADPEPDRLVAALAADASLRERLLAVLGVSAALGDHLARHPEDWRVLGDGDGGTGLPDAAELRAELLRAVGADPDQAQPRAADAGPGALDALRRAYRRALLALAARDLTGQATFAEVTGGLADLAGATLEAALAIARAGLPDDAEPCRLAVIGMGKTGGRELNYVSDVDVIFVAEPLQDEAGALRTATALAAALMRACSETTGEGAIWPVDAALRPEGKAGPLVRTLESHRAYYERWAKTWEFQALLKARPVAGDRELGERYVATVAPLVWSAAQRENFVADVQAMRRRVEEHIPAKQADRQLKLGPGGLRDVEFSVQLLQLVHGRADPTLRSPNTLTALAELARGGYVGRADAAELDEAYRFLRSVEHRIQLYRLRRTHTVPDREQDLRRIGRSLGFRTDPVGEFETAWRRHAREVRRLHEKLFYRPLLVAVARLEPGEARLTPEAARARLEALGYADSAGALRHIEALTTGVSRRAAIQRTLLPVMLGWFADAHDPDGGLLAFRKVSEALGSTPWYLRVLRDEGATAERMARILACGKLPADLLLRAPEAVAMLADDEELRPRSRSALLTEVQAAVRRATSPEQAVATARAIRRRELFRLVAADALGLLDIEAVGQGITDVTAAVVAGALDAATAAWEAEHGRALPTRIAVIAMGRFGGHELQYGSDADVMFVHEPLPGASEHEASQAAHTVANELRRLLQLPATDPPLKVDADLRPEGRQGPLVRTLASYEAYYRRWAHVWESQALLRAEFVAGDPRVGERFTRIIAPVRWPEHGLTEAEVREIRRIKARVEAERLPRGADPTRHTKLGRGGLADVEWTVQLIQLRHAAAVPELRTTRTLAALRVAVAAGLLDPADGDTLAEAWRLASRVRNAIMVVRGRAGDSLPTDLRECAGVARFLGYPPGRTGDLLEDYRRVTRRARSVVERVFYA
ncbi:bifunctional [glutamine synthetase] adenylyltransferase/[glutamine synthetase]-adenylyl-L-tyrosine phosphorylase [Carbonactinospora thermoautotrophica]|uniref:bifunctional [glutamine synthetase] adenylyltransferase/[glutamine synthetase]-adenylyl-L-tyrosine phosphorylase n=1 Tax=Carbonactinospora thermoautotrophica TaxID=1469144 RepID=UPI000D167755|nr:bifunctional [glutamine synthetase] adenylyltransferase/[glutamine synthetase]-adenylyl-L-tyrosine phosphorylase [Carbonactinospora thermoautotrophica]